MDYRELVKELRYCAKDDPICDMTEVCPFYDQRDEEYGYYRCVERMMENAADAIEELQRHYCRHAIRSVHDRGDDSLCDVLMTEPPKLTYEELQAVCNKQEIDLTEMTGELASKPKWIPVTEQCPEKSGDYLVFDDCRDLYVNEWHCLLKKWQYDDGRITHWMPLPEPPKEETE